MPSLLLLEINPGQISQYLDYALYGIFAIIALGFLLGFLRGVWREGFRLVFVGGLVVASVLFTRQAVDFFMDFDISSLAASAGYSTINLNLNNTPILVGVTTPYETIYELLEQSLLAFGFFITPAIADLIIGLTLVILRYLVFIILSIIILFFGETLAAILYFIPFRFFIPYNLRKNLKLRLLGGLAGSLKMVLVLTMFLSPFSSLVNSITRSFKDFDERYGNQIDGELYNEIMSFVNAYDDSTFAQTLFSWSITSNGLSVDSAIMDYVTGQDLNDYRLTLANELGSFVDIAATLIGSGAIDSSFASIETSLLITEDVVTNLVTALTGSVLIMKILPIAVSIGLNLDLISAYVDPDLIDLEDIAWNEELERIGEITKGVIRTGVLEPILAGNSDTITLVDSLFTSQAKPEVNLILNTIDSSPFLSQIIPAVLFGLVQEELMVGLPEGSIGLSTFLPSEWAEYESIAFGSELNIIYDLVYELNAEIDGLFDYVLPTASIANPLGRKLADEPAPSSSIIDLLSENFDLIVEVLIGETEENGTPINNDPITGKGINRSSLLDSDLIINGVPTIVQDLLVPTLTNVAGPNFDDTDLNGLIASFNDGTKGDIRKDYKGEIAGILTILDAVLANETLTGLIEPAEGETLDILALLQDGDFRKGLKQELIPSLDRSQIILTVVPGILEATLTGAGFDDFLQLISLTTADLNFEFTSLSRELIIIVDLMGYAFNVLDASSDLINQFPLIAYDLIGLLDNIYASDIINLNPLSQSKVTNYNKIIKGVFSLVEGIGIDTNDIDTGFNRVTPVGNENGWTTTFVDSNNNDKLDENDTLTFRGENFHLVNFLKTALEAGLLDISGDIFAALNDLTSGSEDIDDPEVATLYKIFAYADRSEIIAASFGGILDNLFGTTGGLLDSDIGTSFRNVTSWTEEGSNLMFLVKQLTNFENGLENLDFLNSDVSMIEELLQGLAASQIFEKPNGDYVFPDFLLNQLTGITSLSSYFVDPDPYQLSFDDDPIDDFTIVRGDFYAISNQASTKENWYGNKTLITDGMGDPILDSNGDLQYAFIGGELENIVGFISELQSVSIDDLTSGVSINGDTIREVMLALNNAPSLRVLIYNVYESIFGGESFEIGSLSLSDSNTFTFLALNKSQRALEIEATANLIDTISAMSLDNGGSFDLANFDTETILTVGELLTTLHDASLFNSFKLGNGRENGDLTVFEQVYEFLLTTATLDTFIYGEELTIPQREQALYQDLISLDNNFGDGSPDDWIGETGEIQRFVDIMVAFVNTDIDFANFAGDAIGDLLNTEPGLVKVEELLLAMNESIIIAPAIGNLFTDVFSSDSFDIGGLTMADANAAYFNNEPLNANRAQEISLILDIYQDISGIGLSGGANFTKDKIDPMKFNTLLTNMYQSNVFNTFKSGKSYLTQDLTIFEQTIRMILNTSTIDTFIYDGETNANRLNLLREDISVLKNSFAQPLVENDWLGELGEISRIINILTKFKDLDIEDFSSFSGAGSSDVLSNLTDTEEGLASVENLLLAMNASTIVYPSIPNLFTRMLSADVISGLEVDFSLANTRYRGNRNDPNNPAIGDQYLPYEESEITSLLSLFNNVKDIGTKSYTDLNLITNEDLDAMQFLLEDIHDSNVFHLQGPSSGLATDLTVFEQMVVMMMNQTRVSDLIYDLDNPNPAYVGQFASKETKARFLVLNFAALFPSNNSTHFTSSWLNTTEAGELTRFFTIFKELKVNLPGTGNFDGIDVGSISPSGISRILAALNYSSLASDAVPGLVKDAFGFISFSTYTEGNEDYYLSPKAYSLTDLNIMDYSGATPLVTQTGVIAQVLNNFYDEDAGSYIDLGANFNMKDYLDDGNSTFAILDLLARSHLFGNLASNIEDPSSLLPGLQSTSLVFKTRALTFYNLLKQSSVTKYFDYLNTTSDEKEKKVSRIEAIFSGDFDTTFEAERLDLFIATISEFTGLSDASSLDQYSAEMKALVTLTYQATGNTIVDRAFMVSELSAGFFTDIFKGEYSNVEDTNAPYFGDANNALKQLNFYDRNRDGTNDFDLLNPIEAEGLEGALEFLAALKTISGTPTAGEVAAMQAALIKMGSRASANVTGGPYPTASDYGNWSRINTSELATLFYAARVVTNAAFDGLSALIISFTTPNPITNPNGVLTILSQQPYEDNFVFEIEGEKIHYGLTA